MINPAEKKPLEETDAKNSPMAYGPGISLEPKHIYPGRSGACRYGWLFILIFSISLFPLGKSAYPAQPQITLSTFTMIPPISNETETGIVETVIKEAFKRIGVNISIENLPAERSLISANDGITDGEYIRISGLDKYYPNLVQVREKIIDFEFVAFSMEMDFKTVGWKSLKPYSVGIITGWKILENNVVGTLHRTDVQNALQLFTLLAKGRADVVIFEKMMGIEMAKSLFLDDVKILEPPLAEKEMFLYLHKKHRKLVPRVEAALKEMKIDGTYKKIFEVGLSGYTH
ncbi:hypothetical protein MNBD_NITROSPINAE02-347 [hydrothermal vent metagenome]|uniref:Uncharacterized protein n=1 Tax=hydrothermal vent metagenome TaxID=652676 RepID=A0A3B1BRM4_9ZZZZ